MSDTEFKTEASKFLNKRVQIIGKHPHKGEWGRAIKVEQTKGLNHPGLYIKGEHGTDFYVFDLSEIEIVNK